jgi:hypothetical protein
MEIRLKERYIRGLLEDPIFRTRLMVGDGGADANLEGDGLTGEDVLVSRCTYTVTI